MKKITEYRNIVFDMGGVLVDYTADNATWHFTDDPEIVREIHNVLFCSQEWMALDLGSITDEEAISRILPRLSDDKVREVARIAFDHWHEYNNVARPGVAAIVKSVKKRGQKAYTLSNVSKRLTDTYKNVVPAPEMYDGAFFSGEVLALKPQPIIYQMFFQRFSLNPSLDKILPVLAKADACAIGPGLGQNEATRTIVEVAFCALRSWQEGTTVFSRSLLPCLMYGYRRYHTYFDSRFPFYAWV